MGVIESRIFDQLGRELPGVRVDLFNESGTRIDTDVTPTQDGRPSTPGRYRFDNLAPGKYTIKAVGRGLDGYNRPDDSSVRDFTIIDDLASIGEAQILAKIQDGTLETQEGAIQKAITARDEAKAASRPVTWTPTAIEVGARPDSWLPSKGDVGLGNVENKSSAVIRSEITKANVTDTGLAPDDIGAETPAGAQTKADAAEAGAKAASRPATWTPSALEVGARPDSWTPSAAEVGADPAGSAAIAEANAKAASRPVTWTPTATEVGARPDSWTPSKADVGLGNVENKSSSMIRSEITKANVTATGLAAGDVGAETPAGAQSKADAAEINAKSASRPSTWMPSATEVGADPAGSAATAESNAKAASRPVTWTPTAGDVGARPNDWVPNATEVGARPDTWMPTKADVGLGSVENKSSTTIRSEITKTNVTATGLAAGDIGAETPTGAQTKANTAESNAKAASRPVSWTPTAAEVGARPDSWIPTATEVGARPNTWLPTKSDVGLGSVENKSSATIRSEITKTNVTSTGLAAGDIGAETPAGAQSKASTAETNAKNEITSRGLDASGGFTGTLNGVSATRAYQETSKSITATGWYRIALNSGNRAHARFLVHDPTSGRHGSIEFSLGCFYNKASLASFSLLSAGRYSGQTIQKVRLLTNGTYDTMYVEVYLVSPSGTLSVQILDNYQSSGWTIQGLTAGSIPTGYTVTEWTVNPDDVVQPNNKLIKANVTATGLAAGDIGAETPAAAQSKADAAETNAKNASRPISWMPSAAEVGARANTWLPTKSEIGLGSVENKSSATIRSEITKANVTTTSLSAVDVGAETPAGAETTAISKIAAKVGEDYEIEAFKKGNLINNPSQTSLASAGWTLTHALDPTSNPDGVYSISGGFGVRPGIGQDVEEIEITTERTAVNLFIESHSVKIDANQLYRFFTEYGLGGINPDDLYGKQYRISFRFFDYSGTELAYRTYNPASKAYTSASMGNPVTAWLTPPVMTVWGDLTSLGCFLLPANIPVSEIPNVSGNATYHAEIPSGALKVSILFEWILATEEREAFSPVNCDIINGKPSLVATSGGPRPVETVDPANIAFRTVAYSCWMIGNNYVSVSENYELVLFKYGYQGSTANIYLRLPDAANMNGRILTFRANGSMGPGNAYLDPDGLITGQRLNGSTATVTLSLSAYNSYMIRSDGLHWHQVN